VLSDILPDRFGKKTHRNRQEYLDEFQKIFFKSFLFYLGMMVDFHIFIDDELMADV